MKPLKQFASSAVHLIINSILLALVFVAVLLAFVVIGILLIVVFAAWAAPIVAGILWHPSWLLTEIPVLAIYLVCLYKMKAHDQSEPIQEA